MFANSPRTEDRRFLRYGIPVLALAAIFLLAGCADDDETSFPAPPLVGLLEIIGNYTDDFGGTHQVNQTRWISGTLSFQILGYFNGFDFLLAQNDASNVCPPFDCSPNKFSRFSWTTFQTSLYFCQNPFDAETFEAAFNSAAPDNTDPSTGGCGGFSWTQLTQQ